MTAIGRIVLALSLLWAPAIAQPAPTNAVDIALVLVVDVSGTIDEGEFILQRDGIAGALASEEIVQAIEQGALGRIAVAMVEFSDYSAVDVVMSWIIIGDMESAQKAAAIVLASPRGGNMQNTSVAGGMLVGIRELTTCPCIPTKLVMDVSGDGENNNSDRENSLTMENARAQVERYKITVNALAMPTMGEDVEGFYDREVRYGPGSFLMVAPTINDFAKAMRRKLVLEVS